MIGHKLPNKTKSATVVEPKKTSPTKQALHVPDTSTGTGTLQMTFYFGKNFELQRYTPFVPKILQF
jgi:hypothetical protein